MIPFMRLDRQFESIRSQIMAAVTPVLETGNVLQSKEVVTFEQRVAGLCGTKYAIAVNSGTDALIFALMALGLPRGSRIGVTTMSFVASASAIVNAGHTPVFFDIVPDTMLMDVEAAVAAIAARQIDAVLAVHLYGQSLDIETLRAAADARGIPLIEDAAQALGSLRNGKPVGGDGLAGCLSFDPTKVIGAYGSGGAVITNDEAFAKQIRLLRYHGHAGEQRYVVPRIQQPAR
jgi:dTDP-4-amino-4,6-dideoxygalactose transaminase